MRMIFEKNTADAGMGVNQRLPFARIALRHAKGDSLYQRIPFFIPAFV